MTNLFDPNLLSALQGAAATAPTPVVRLAPGLGDDSVLAASNLLSATANVEGMLRPFQAHQAAAYHFANDSIARWGGVLVGDDMGMGKTQVALALLADAVRTTTKPGLVIAPPVAVAGWFDDLRAAFPSLRMVHLKGRTAYTPPPADLYFLSDDAQTLRAWLAPTQDSERRLILTPFATSVSMLVRDEIHRDKGAMGKPSSPTSRARLMLTLSKALRERQVPVVGMTGTLLTNRPVEAFLPLQIIGGPDLIKALTPGAQRMTAFLFTYTDPKNNGYGWNYNGVDLSKMSQLHEYLRRTVYVRREKSDLGDVLPHGGWIVKPIALNGVLRRYAALERDFLATVRDEEGPAAAMRKSRMETAQRMFALWQEAGVAKAQAAVEYVEDLLEQGQGKVVMFYWHQDVFHALSKALVKAKIPTVVINGQVTGDARTDAMREFQNGSAQVMLAQIKAAGMAVTLTAASDAVFVQSPWSAGDLKQAADRILRADTISMDRAARGESVRWHVLNAAKEDGGHTFDHYMWQVLEHKAQVVDAVNAGRPVTMSEDDVQHAVLEAWYADQA